MLPFPHRTSAVLLVAILSLVTSCSSIRVVPASKGEALLSVLKENLIGNYDPAPRTQQTLRKYNLEDLARTDEPEAEARLLKLYKSEPSPDILYALAELSFLHGRRAEHWNHRDSLAPYYRAAGYAYHYLFATVRPAQAAQTDWFTPQDSFDPRFRLACELYNQSLAKCIKAATRVGEIDPGHTLKIPTPDGGTFRLSVKQFGFVWKSEDFHDIQLCEEFKVEGLANHHRSYGLGVPLIATRTSQDNPNETFLPRRVSFPVTAFFRFDGNLEDLARGRCGRLELYDPLRVQAIDVGNQRVPLEADLTTPLAYGLSRSELSGPWLDGFLRPQRVLDQTGIYMLEPYNPGKIPVLFVHGLLSSPLTWAPMFNDLRAEPDLRNRYQFWFYFYPTSVPYLATAADLRSRLEKIRQSVDPERRDPNFDSMVLVAHSMGGLVSRLQSVDSGDAFASLLGEKPLEKLQLSDATKELLRKVLYFEANPSIADVIFIGTPHRGSQLSTSFLGRIGSQVAGVPRLILQAGREIWSAGQLLGEERMSFRIPNSVEMLKPNSPALEVLLNLPRVPSTSYHSIIGIADRYDLLLERIAGGQHGVVGDAVVPYTSAHLANVESEIIVPANHFNVHQHPLAVLEVRRILRERLTKPAPAPARLDRPAPSTK